ncbi:MAG: POTRA domain-containing protein, partial [Bryobacteraceae bacterium]
MMFFRRGCLAVRLLWLVSIALLASAQQQQPAQPKPQQPPPEQPQRPKPPNPFETVPTGPAQQPALERPKAPPPARVTQTQPGAPPEDIIEEIQFRGSRRVPQDTLRALIGTRKGARYDEERLRRDFIILWNTGRFDDIRLEREPGTTGWIIRFVVTERPVVRSLKY